MVFNEAQRQVYLPLSMCEQNNTNDVMRRHTKFESIVAYLLKARILEPENQPLLGNDYVTPNNVITLEDVFSVWSVPRLYNEDQLPLEELEVGVRWPPACENLSPGAEQRPLLEDVTKQRSEGRD
jgi:hypothetical protein